MLTQLCFFKLFFFHFFEVRVRFVYPGEGPSKKAAKKNAAFAMLQCVTNCADDFLLNIDRSVAVAHPNQVAS
jgi:hypothetical protein